MFNDEVESVRLNATRSLRLITNDVLTNDKNIRTVFLDEEKLETALLIIYDSSEICRKEGYKMLG